MGAGVMGTGSRRDGAVLGLLGLGATSTAGMGGITLTAGERNASFWVDIPGDPAVVGVAGVTGLTVGVMGLTVGVTGVTDLEEVVEGTGVMDLEEVVGVTDVADLEEVVEVTGVADLEEVVEVTGLDAAGAARTGESGSTGVVTRESSSPSSSKTLLSKK